MANVGPNSWYCSSVGWAAVTAWPVSTALTAGTLCRQNTTPAVGSERVFAVTITGTTGGTEPTWVITKGVKTITDGTAVFSAGVRFSITVTLSSPRSQMIGYLFGTVNVSGNSLTVIIDPLLTLS